MSDTRAETELKSGIPVAGIIITMICLAVFGTIIVGLIRSRAAQTDFIPEIARYGMIQDFALIDHSGEPFSLENVEGKIWVANFIFTSCATECPLISRRMEEIQNNFQHDKRVELVSISVDPRTDNPERLAKYANMFNAGPKWSFLTGDEKVIKNLSTKSFMMIAPEDKIEETSIARTRQLLHSEKIAVVDQLGVVRFYANGMNPKASRQVIEAVSTLLNEG